MNSSDPAFAEIPIDQIEEDPDQPRENFGMEGENNPLLLSIKSLGVGNAVLVLKADKDKYLIVDGHRRFRAAKGLGAKKIWCRVYPKLNPGDFALMRYHVQNIRRQWKPLERAQSFVQIQQSRKIKTIKEIATLVHLSESTVRQAMALRNLKIEHLDLMNQYGLGPAYKNEFVRLRGKLRKIKEVEINDIIHNIFDRVQRKVIKSSKEFRKLGSIFNRATINEAEIYRFLKNPQMTVQELESRCSTSSLSLQTEQMIKKFIGMQSTGVTLSEQEDMGFRHLHHLLHKKYG